MMLSIRLLRVSLPPLPPLPCSSNENFLYFFQSFCELTIPPISVPSAMTAGGPQGTSGNSTERYPISGSRSSHTALPTKPPEPQIASEQTGNRRHLEQNVSDDEDLMTEVEADALLGPSLPSCLTPPRNPLGEDNPRDTEEHRLNPPPPLRSRAGENPHPGFAVDVHGRLGSVQRPTVHDILHSHSTNHDVPKQGGLFGRVGEADRQVVCFDRDIGLTVRVVGEVLYGAVGGNVVLHETEAEAEFGTRRVLLPVPNGVAPPELDVPLPDACLWLDGRLFDKVGHVFAVDLSVCDREGLVVFRTADGSDEKCHDELLPHADVHIQVDLEVLFEVRVLRATFEMFSPAGNERTTWVGAHFEAA
ncbi:hypothetical protein JB92DRAFT_3140203 [Gautieria morchelliformis]|nr:hypothetical protein JB92DRAFT_3140203 [Gautieria morchelliformis]